MNATVAKITAGTILIIMALTWAAISIKLGVMVAVSDNFLWLAGALGTVVFGDGDMIGGLLSKLRVQK